MGINDDLCVLGLGLTSSDKSAPPPPPLQRQHEPSLTLSLFGETFDRIKKVDFDYNKVCSNDVLSTDPYGQDSAASSLSNVSVKRERDMGSEEAETERVSSRVSDEDDDGSNGRKKLRLTKAQSALLEESFKLHSTLNPKQKQDLARELKLRPRQVEVWFQNRRARTKLKQTEVDCEFLKKCCETLTDDNRRLQKELQELKALKLAQPLYMQLPAATLTMCPSCERIGGSAAAENAAKSPFAKPHFYNRFTNPSAAC
ncbi:Homeobox-leucine zipper protein family [Perilla frutescens var. hirtella]|uniref:Homeobox-leucine zipper protein family n=1 Tax=Perilla frutescens var. hirtella TaxID=608512 RepID=A0AAD4J6C1_PERFH|nr:Homeobox-leucine zipper protein family [Perilla frutescens var. hirtella]